MADIVLAAGNNELNVQMIPVTAPPPAVATLYGKVTDSKTGVALSGVSVGLWSGTTLIASDLTDSNGNYQITSITPGTYSVVFSKENYVTVTK